MCENQEFLCTPPEIREIAVSSINNLLPNKSRGHYEKQYSQFQKWCTENKIQAYTENILIAYFEILSKKYKFSTLWTIYSMLRSCLSIKKDVDISKYTKLQALLKRLSDGYDPKKSKILEEDNIKKFIEQADDIIYLAMKVIFIMGFNGACRREELVNMPTDDVEYRPDLVMVSVPKTKNNMPRMFLITDKNWIKLIKKYSELRPKNVTHKRFFLTYRNGKCVNSPIGINIMGKVPKNIAKFLQLPDPEHFTGHCFRRSSATHIANKGGDLLTLKRHGGWRSSAVAESYVDASLNNKIALAKTLSSDKSLVDLPQCSGIGMQYQLHGNRNDPPEIYVNSSKQNVVENNLTGVSISSQDTANVTVHIYNNCTFQDHKLKN